MVVLLVDASVLIDYLDTDDAILALAAHHLGQVIVPAEILAEVDQLDAHRCAQLGLTIVEATVAQLAEAASGAGPLSFPDRVCLILARDGGWVCVTNDRALRRECAAVGVAVRWSLELMVDLVRGGHLEAAAAITTAEAIGRINPRHITRAILQRFRRRLQAFGKDP